MFFGFSIHIGSDRDMTIKGVLALLVVAPLLMFFFSEHPANESNVSKSNENTNRHSRCKDDRNDHSCRVKPPIISSIAESIDSNPVTSHKKTNGRPEKPANSPANSLNWVEIESFRVAEENILIQKSMDGYARRMVDISSVSLFFVLLSILASFWGIWLLKKTLDATNTAIDKAAHANVIAQESIDETKQSNILQLQPWLNVARPEIVETDFKHIQFMTGEEGSFCFGIKFSITNVGKTPVTSICFDFTELTILIKTGRKHTFLKGDCSPHLKILSINPTKEPEDFIIYVQFTGGEVVEAGWFTEVEQFLSGDHSINDIFFIINADIRFKDKFTDKGEHRCINVLAKNKIVRPKSAGKANKILRIGVERPDVDRGRFDILDKEDGHDEQSD